MYVQNNLDLLAALDEHVTGHIDAKKALIVLLNRGVLRAHQKFVKMMDYDMLVKPLKVLLVGASGTGKTHLVNTLQKLEAFPLVKVDATDLNPTGASGGIKSDKLSQMIRDEAQLFCQMLPFSYPYIEYAIERTVVYIDEIDKLGTSFESSGSWNRHVQSNFLTLLDNKDEFSGVSFILSGAFDSITGKKETKKSKPIGFHHHAQDDDVEMLDEQILKSGIIPELLGRINMVVELDKFSRNDIIDIIKKRILPAKQRDLASLGILGVKLSTRQMIQIAEKTLRSGQGVRFAQREVDRIFLNKEFEGSASDVLLIEEWSEEFDDD